MYKLGLTGGIGSGKSLVCSILETLGVPVYYADKEARRMLKEDSGLRKSVTKLLGEEAYVGAEYNREFVAGRVFGNHGLLLELNRLVHPAVRNDFSQWADTRSESPYVVEEAAILFESGAYRFLDGTVLIYAPESIRVRRVKERDGVDEDQVRKRMMHQMDEEQKKERADFIIYNDDRSMLLPQVIDLHNKILTF
jgi:dephospho-CoA kinase